MSDETRFQTCGPNTIPTSNMPISGGSLILRNRLPSSSADNRMIANEVKNDIKYSFQGKKKADALR